MEFRFMVAIGQGGKLILLFCKRLITYRLNNGA